VPWETGRSKTWFLNFNSSTIKWGFIWQDWIPIIYYNVASARQWQLGGCPYLSCVDLYFVNKQWNLEKTNMKSINKIKMSSGNSTRCVGEKWKFITEVYWYYIHILVKNLAGYCMLIINALRFCKLYTTISNLSCFMFLWLYQRLTLHLMIF